MPQMLDPNFSGTLTYICEHNEHGAMGITINKPADLSLVDVLDQLDIALQGKDQTVYSGGPVQHERGFVLHTDSGKPSNKQWQSSLQIAENINLTSSKDILTAIGEGGGPEKYLVALGYAGWGAGQLEQELKENIWLTCTADLGVLFDSPCDEKFKNAVAILGIATDQLNGQIGHA